MVQTDFFEGLYYSADLANFTNDLGEFNVLTDHLFADT